MTTFNRADRLKNTFRVLKKRYKPVAPTDRSVLEHMLYACCLEHAPFEAADEAFARLQQTYFDWNEVRVTTVSELADIMSVLPAPLQAGAQLRRSLQSVFESFYSFDLEELKKENIGKAVKQLERLTGVTGFVIAYVTQNGLGGHRVPFTSETVETLRVLGVLSDREAERKNVPGLERAISKNHGIEFGSLLHQLSIDFASAPFSPRVRKIFLEIAADASQRFPKRSSRKKTPAADSRRPAKSAGSKSREAKKTGAKKQGPKKQAPKTQGSKTKRSKTPGTKSGTTAGSKKSARKTTPDKKSARPAKKTPKTTAKKVTKKKLAGAAKKKPTKKSATTRLTKKKPR